MEFIIVENFNDSITLILDADGGAMTFDKLSEAKEYAALCQNGIVLPLAPQLTDVITETAEWLGIALYEFGEFEEEFDENGKIKDTIEDKLWNLLGN